jgi:rhamnosyltransferase
VTSLVNPSRAVGSCVPRASVIIRTKDSERTLGRVLSLVRAQTVPTEIIVVDSGSSDETLAIAHESVDRIIEIPADSFSFGHALNVGAAAARAPIHIALSSHALPPDDRWIERSLSKYDRPDVAGTSGAPTPPDSPESLLTTLHQTLTDALNRPWWGFSNTGSTWRADVWASFPFDEQLPACEDKEWGFRVLAAGWTIAIDSTLLVSDAHRRQDGLRQLYRRTRREFAAIGSFASIPPFTIRDFLREWLTEIPAHATYRGWRRRLNYFRLVELVGKYQGLKANDASIVLPVAAASREPPPTDVQGAVDRI